MILRELTLENFRAFRGRNELLFPAPSSESPRVLCLIGGMNGRGKTTILDALLLALYGSRARCSNRGRRAYDEFLADCIHRAPTGENIDHAAVELEFDEFAAGELLRLRIVRRWHRTPSGPAAETTEVFRDGKADPEWTEAWDERIERLIPLGTSNLFFFDGEEVRALADSRVPSSSVRTAILTLMGLELPSRLDRDLDVVTRRVRRERAGSAEYSGVSELERTLEAESKRLAEITGQRAQQARVVDDLRLELKSVEAEFAQSGGRFAQDRAALEQKLSAARARIETWRKELQELAGGMLPFALVAPLAKRTLGRLREEFAGASAHDVMALIARHDERLLHYLGQQRLGQGKLEKIVEFLSSERAQMEKPVSGPAYLGATRECLGSFERLLGGELAAEGTHAARLLRSIHDSQADIKRLETRISTIAAPDTITDQVRAIDALRERLLKAEREFGALEERAGECNREVDRLQRLLAQENQRQAEATRASAVEQRIVRVAARVKEVLREYQQRLQVVKIDSLEEHIGERFQLLLEKKQFISRVRLDPSTFELTLFGFDGKRVEHEWLSAGEQQLLAIAYLWGLRVASGRHLPVVIDTPLSRLDSSHRRNLVERYLPLASHQVVLLSTDVEIDQTFFDLLRREQILSATYLLHHRPDEHRTTIKAGYFWS